MTGHHNHGGSLGVFAVVAAVAFAFGVDVARCVVGSALVAGVLFFAYVVFRVATGAI